MSIKNKIKNLFNKGGSQKRNAMFLNANDFKDWLCKGYTSLDNNPEVVAGCRIIAELISSMTIYLMQNGDKGDVRIKNALSRHIDIEPNKYMTRKTWMESIVMNLLLYGSGNSVVLPKTENGLLGDLIPIPSNQFSFVQDGYGYKVNINGTVYDYDDVLHFVYNPDNNYPWKGKGVTATIRDVVENLSQATETKKGFMKSDFKPSMIIKVDGLVDEFSSPEGREKLLEEYVKTKRAGEPWLIPADQFSVEQVHPLSLTDLAINDSVVIDKKTVASILGVPPFVLGVGEFNAAEWDNFINTTIKTIAQGIEQELTRKLLLSDKWYWKFNMNTLYSYDLKKIAEVFGEMYARGLVTGNEVRDKMSLSPMDELDKLVLLENYIPLDKIADQKKLLQGE